MRYRAFPRMSCRSSKPDAIISFRISSRSASLSLKVSVGVCDSFAALDGASAPTIASITALLASAETLGASAASAGGTLDVIGALFPALPVGAVTFDGSTSDSAFFRISLRRWSSIRPSSSSSFPVFFIFASRFAVSAAASAAVAGSNFALTFAANRVALFRLRLPFTSNTASSEFFSCCDSQ